MSPTLKQLQGLYRNKSRLSRLSIILALGVFAALTLLVLRVQKDADNIDKNPTEENQRKFDTSLESAKAIVNGIGTVATVGAGFILYLNFTVANRNAEIANRNTEIANRNAEIANRNVELTESRLITERFSKAVEQLGSDKLEVRLGGIYALERIAQDSDRDYWTIMEVLTSFVREKSPSVSEEQICVKAYELSKARGSASSPEKNWYDAEQELMTKPISEDVQAVLTVIGRREVAKDPSKKRINLSRANLNNANLREANLSNADLSYTNLSSADLKGANLSKTYLVGINLSNADLNYTNLNRASLLHANLNYAQLMGANLSHAYPINANLSNACLYNTNFSHANLGYSNLSHADLSNADLSNADLSDADLSNADLSDANLSNADLSDANLSHTSIKEEQLDKAFLCKTVLSNGLAQSNRDCKKLEALKNQKRSRFISAIKTATKAETQ